MTHATHSYTEALKAALDFLQLGHSVGLGNVDDDVVDALEEQIKQALSQPTGPSERVKAFQEAVEVCRNVARKYVNKEGDDDFPLQKALDMQDGAYECAENLEERIRCITGTPATTGGNK